MNRADFIRSSLGRAAALVAGVSAEARDAAAPPPAAPCQEGLEKARRDRDSVDNWVSDLLDAMDTKLDAKTKVRPMEACGRGCFLRHRFKTDLAAKGRGSIDRLVEAYRASFEAW